MPFSASITNEELAALPRGAFDGEIVIVETEQQVRQVCRVLERESVMGFDTETRPSFKPNSHNNVALLQLATENQAFLFRLSKMQLPAAIINLFENQAITKVGAATRDDIKGLCKLRQFRAAGFLDLQSTVGQWGITDLALRKMGAIVLGVSISKAQRLSNWEAESYTPAQALYAATDAWLCLKIYKKLLNSKKSPAIVVTEK